MNAEQIKPMDLYSNLRKYQVYPIKLNSKQLEALSLGAEKLWVPVDLSKRPEHKEYSHFCSKCDSSKTHVHLGNGEYECEYCRTRFYSRWKVFELGDGEFEDLVHQVTSPLQIGEEYFVQEEQVETGPCADIPSLGVPAMDVVTALVPADQMTKEQSNYKFRVTGTEVKQTRQIDLEDFLALGIATKFDFEERGWELHKQWHNNQYPEQPYNSNCYGFLITIERI